MSNNNRNRGNSCERTIVQKINKKIINNPDIDGTELRKLSDDIFILYPKLGTTRELSRAKDAKKVDIIPVNPDRYEEFKYNIQVKSLNTASAPYAKLLSEVKTNNKKGVPVLFHRQTQKKGEKFYTKDEFACLYLDDFIDIIIQIKKLESELKKLKNERNSGK